LLKSFPVMLKAFVMQQVIKPMCRLKVFKRGEEVVHGLCCSGLLAQK
jgi:hypothetical protein